MIKRFLGICLVVSLGIVSQSDAMVALARMSGLAQVLLVLIKE